ncbi:CDP-glycerol--glycerophosphate glycerophosphotransferase, partial [Campylobacter jejuni]|nr:CDP-glycerol--glycerophosphate glycerophosphotransferase [Campylobacter jejuni]
ASKKYFIKASNNFRDNAKAYFKTGMCCFHLKEWNDAKVFFEQACFLKETPNWRKQLKQVYNHLKFGFFLEQKLWWKEVDRLKQELNHGNEQNFILLRDLAIACEAMKRYNDAVKYYKESILIQEKQKIPIESVWYYRLGFCCEKIKDIVLSNKFYGYAIKFDEELESDIYGIGVFHEKMGYWSEANVAYLNKIQELEIVYLDKIFYKIAFSFEMLYDWKNSEKYYHKAIENNYHCSVYHYRLGVVLEKQNKIEQASIFYTEAFKRDSYCRAEYFYRLANCLMKLDHHKEACKIFAQINRINNNIFDQNLNFLKDDFFRQKVIY